MDQLNFNTLEADIERLSNEIKEKKSQFEAQQIPQREMVKQTLAPMVSASPNIVSGVQQDMTPIEVEVLPEYMKEASPELKLAVEKLVELVFQKGIAAAAQEAQKMGPFVVDAFHDALTDKIHDELVRRNLI